MTEEKEGKGFVFKDRRKLSLDEEPPQPEQQPQTEKSAGPTLTEGQEERVKAEFDKASEQEQRKSRQEVPLPEVTFATFVFSLSTSALVHLGEMPEPTTQRTQEDLALAKQIIDTLGMLEEKTRGNLDADEERLLKSMLYDLRLRYVQKSK